MGNSDSKKKKNKNKNDNEVKNVYGFSMNGIKGCSGQDSYHFFGFNIDNTNIKFMGVYDGHGEKGKEASNFVEREIKRLVSDNKRTIKKLTQQQNSRESISKLFIELYKKIQNSMKKSEGFYEYSGSCAVSALIVDKACYVINLGDSRAVIGGKLIDNIFAYQMSVDHKPDEKEESDRIKKQGGEVKVPDNGGPKRVYKLNENNPGLAVARSLGDTFVF